MIALAVTPQAPAAVVLDDHFDDGALGTNTSGVGGGFVANSSSNPASSITESGTTVSITEDLNDADGIASTNSFDLSAGVTAIWQVSSLSFGTTGGNRNTFYGLQDTNNGWLFEPTGARSVGITIDAVNDTVVFRRQNGTNTDRQDTTQSLDNDFSESNFTITAVYTPAGYNISSSGLGNEINISGSWDVSGIFSFAALFGGGDLYASAYIQDNTGAGSTGNLTIDRIQLDTVTAIVPAPAALPAGIGLLGLLAAHRRRG
jgi:hypothetical protein